MKTKLYSLFAIVTFSVTAWSQGISVSEAGEEADESAILDIQSTTKGFLPPRMSEADRDAIANPATGLIVYNTDEDCIQVNNGTPGTPNWVCLGAAATPQYQVITGNRRVFTGTITLAANDFLLISNDTQATTLNLPALTMADAGRMISVLNNNATGAVNVIADPALIVGTTVILNRVRGYIWDGARWWHIVP